MATITTNVTLSQLRVNLQQIATRLVNPDLTKVMKAAAIMGISEIKDRFSTSTGPDGNGWAPLKYPRPRTGGNDKPLRDTGILMASFAHKETSNSLVIGTVQPQAQLMHFGGIVKPKRGKFLAIPLTKAAVYAGSPLRFSGPTRGRYGRGALSPRINKAKTGGVLVDANGVAQFAFTKQVTVPARPFMGFSKQWMDDFHAMLAEFLLTGRI